MNYTVTTRSGGYYTLNTLGFDSVGRTAVRDTLKACYDTDVLYENLSGTELNIVFRLPGTNFVFQLVFQDNLFEAQVGSGWVNSTLQNAAAVPELGWQRGLIHYTHTTITQTLVCTASGFLLSWRSGLSIHDNYYGTKMLGASLLVRDDGTVHPTELDVWRGSLGSITTDSGTIDGQWVTVRRYDQATYTFTKSQDSRMPFIGFQQFPNGVDSTGGKLYGVKCYSVFAPYYEFALFRTFPGDVFSPGSTVTDERGRKWWLSEKGTVLWNELQWVFPYQLSMQYTRTGVAW